MTLPDGAAAPAEQPPTEPPAADGGPGAPGPAAGAADPSGAAPQAPDADEVPPGYRRSGLRNPAGAVRGMGAAALGLQGIMLLLVIAPIRALGQGGSVEWVAAALALICFVLCGMMRRPWVWTAGSVVQALLLVGGLLHWTLFALGVIFGVVWLYVLYVRRSILR
ncbi:DUF4233 domain-containing protein [Asanoa sp. NPDC049573]|uniref:DUF4233 domain-containing protein n=1 Tax=Asanoa sp. NPDC049573 TaxID=3155396 RepID=UPI00342CE1D4